MITSPLSQNTPLAATTPAKEAAKQQTELIKNEGYIRNGLDFDYTSEHNWQAESSQDLKTAKKPPEISRCLPWNGAIQDQAYAKVKNPELQSNL